MTRQEIDEWVKDSKHNSRGIEKVRGDYVCKGCGGEMFNQYSSWPCYNQGRCDTPEEEERDKKRKAERERAEKIDKWVARVVWLSIIAPLVLVVVFK